MKNLQLTIPGTLKFLFVIFLLSFSAGELSAQPIAPHHPAKKKTVAHADEYSSKGRSIESGHYKIFNTRTKSICTLQEIVEHFGDRDVVFFGEEHNDSVGHFLQDTLYTALISRYHKVTLSMEMFERDCQVVLDEYVNGFITERQLIKEGRAWDNYDDYANLVNTARAQGQETLAANAPRRYVNLVNRKGLVALNALGKDSKNHFAKLPIDTVNALYSAKFSALMGVHAVNRNLYYSQTLWDATMAESIYTYWKKRKKTKIFQLNGRFHSDERLGTVTQIQRMDNHIKIGTISCFRADDFHQPDWTRYEHLADFVIITDPSVPSSY